MFSATRSPNKSCRALPRTMATLVLASDGTTDPSGMSHSTLVSQESGKYFFTSRRTHVQSTCLNTSSKKGTPASTPCGALVRTYIRDSTDLLTPLLPQSIASCSSSPTTKPAQSNDGVSSANHLCTSALQEGGRRWAKF